jgi:hypothetical protein
MDASVASINTGEEVKAYKIHVSRFGWVRPRRKANTCELGVEQIPRLDEEETRVDEITA